MHKTYIYLFFLSICLTSCQLIEKKDLSGEWIINKAFYNKSYLVTHSMSVNAVMLPNGYQDKSTVNFNIDDQTVSFPGVNTEDIPCKWEVQNEKLYVVFDTAEFTKKDFASIDALHVKSILTKDQVLKKQYKVKYDSIQKKEALKIDSIKSVISIYTGVYNIRKENNASLILSSKYTWFELLNSEAIFKQQVDKMFRGL